MRASAPIPFWLRDWYIHTVLFFYSPTCGHCKEAVPKLKAFYETNKAQGARVLAIATEGSVEDWKKFIRDYKLEELYNGFDNEFKHDFRTEYDVYTTPTIYVLEKNKKIIARKMPVEQLDDFLQFYLRNRGSKQ